jgi:hypothetical protein
VIKIRRFTSLGNFVCLLKVFICVCKNAFNVLNINLGDFGEELKKPAVELFQQRVFYQ